MKIKISVLKRQKLLQESRQVLRDKSSTPEEVFVACVRNRYCKQELSQSEMAKLCKVSQGFISKLLSKQISEPGFGVMFSIAAGLKIDLRAIQKGRGLRTLT